MPLTGTRRNQHATCIREKRRRHSLKPLKPEKWPTLQPICAAARDYGRMTAQPESAGINRYVVGDARALQERKQRIHPGLESCRRYREVSLEA